MRPCPCLSQRSYEECCQPYLDGTSAPKTAEALMRSRYTAFTQGNMEYIGQTHDPKTRKDLDLDANQKWADESEWLGLKILSTKAGKEDDVSGHVEFIASYRDTTAERQHHELATFRQEDGQWFFVGGHPPKQETYTREAPKIGRNDPCFCGSEKKYKKCCLQKGLR